MSKLKVIATVAQNRLEETSAKAPAKKTAPKLAREGFSIDEMIQKTKIKLKQLNDRLVRAEKNGSSNIADIKKEIQGTTEFQKELMDRKAKRAEVKKTAPKPKPKSLDKSDKSDTDTKVKFTRTDTKKPVGGKISSLKHSAKQLTQQTDINGKRMLRNRISDLYDAMSATERKKFDITQYVSGQDLKEMSKKSAGIKSVVDNHKTEFLKPVEVKNNFAKDQKIIDSRNRKFKQEQKKRTDERKRLSREMDKEERKQSGRIDYDDDLDKSEKQAFQKINKAIKRMTETKNPALVEKLRKQANDLFKGLPLSTRKKLKALETSPEQVNKQADFSIENSSKIAPAKKSSNTKSTSSPSSIYELSRRIAQDTDPKVRLSARKELAEIYDGMTDSERRKLRIGRLVSQQDLRNMSKYSKNIENALNSEGEPKSTRKDVESNLENYRKLNKVRPKTSKTTTKEVPKDANGKRYTKRGVSQMLKQLREQQERGRKTSNAYKQRQDDIKRLSKILESLGSAEPLKASDIHRIQVIASSIEAGY